jgi:hypothetical protein
VPEHPQARVTELARTALAFLDQHIADHPERAPHASFDRPLLASLEPFESRPKLWLTVKCSCGRRVTRATYDDGGIFLGHELREKLRRGAAVIRPAPGPTPNVEIAHDPHPAGFEEEPAGAHVWARRKLRCPDPSCGHTFTYSAVGLLRAWLRAVASGSEVLVLGQRPSAEAPPVRTTRLTA